MSKKKLTKKQTEKMLRAIEGEPSSFGSMQNLAALLIQLAISGVVLNEITKQLNNSVK